MTNTKVKNEHKLEIRRVVGGSRLWVSRHIKRKYFRQTISYVEIIDHTNVVEKKINNNNIKIYINIILI